MLTPRYLTVVMSLALLYGVARGAGEAPAAATSAPADPMSRVLPDIDFSGVGLDDALDYLRDLVPEFKTVLVRDKGVPDDYPTVKIKLKKVTLGQVWSVLQTAMPDLEVQPVGENDGSWPIYVIRVKAPSGEGGPGGPAVAPLAVRVYPLGPLVDAMTAKAGKKPGHENEPLNDILSLIKATLAQVPDRSEPVLQVHEETRTLIFKGNSEQKAALEQVLSALPPDAAPEASELIESKQHVEKLQEQINQQQEQSARQVQQLESELAEMRSRLAEAEKNALEQTANAEKLKVRLEQQMEQAARIKEQAEEDLVRFKRDEQLSRPKHDEHPELPAPAKP